jgi:two-component system chemotaxis sensor kinase CheA
MAIKDPYRYFRVEARDLLEQLGRATLDLEKSPDGSAELTRILRLAHTLKGAARVVKQRGIAEDSHAIEDVLAPLRDAGVNATREQIDKVLRLLDQIAGGVAALGVDPETAVAGTGTSAAAPPEFVGRIDSGEFEALIEVISQSNSQLARLRRDADAATRARALAGSLLERLTPGMPGACTWHTGQALAEDLRASLGRLERSLETSVEHLDRNLRQAHDTATRLRLVPASNVFTVLERAVRDTAHATGKEARFEGRGGDVRLETRSLGALQGPLLQIVRNAVAHGIEAPERRKASGKPVAGVIAVEVARRGQSVIFRCADDGAGVDLDAVRTAARRKGLLGADTEALDAEAILRLLVRGGISTAASVTDISGRGIGLDLVQNAVAQLRGDFHVHTQAGQGTTFELRLPLTIAALDTLTVQAGDAHVSLPLDAVLATQRLRADEIVRTPAGESVVFQGSAIPFVPLARLLSSKHDVDAVRRQKQVSMVIMAGTRSRAAFGVDHLQGIANIVLRPLPALAPASPIVFGSSLDVAGNPQIVLDPEALVQEAHQATVSSGRAEVPLHPVLVVDDSPTTRMLEQSILESAGYEVHCAVSAEEGLSMARRRKYGLILVDVEMPGMDGFAFIECIRADPALRDTPAILVTSRSSSQDRSRAEEVGARGYIVKGEFEQDEFLRQVRRTAVHA